MCNDLDDGLFWCLVDRSDQLDEQHIALEAIIFRTGSFSKKPRYCFVQLYQRHGQLVQILIGHANLPYLV